MVQFINERQAKGMLIYSNYIHARYFDDPVHRANVLRPALMLFVRRFGNSVVADEVRTSAPGLLQVIASGPHGAHAAAELPLRRARSKS